MDTAEAVKRYFEQLPQDKKPTAQEIRDAAASIGEAASAIADIIIAHATAQGIDPEQDLTALYAAQERAKKEAAKREHREAVKVISLEIGKQVASLVETAETASPDELTETIASIGKKIAGLTTTAATVNRFPSWIDYEQSWKRETDRYFAPSLFDGLDFPEGTVSYIGARTGRGKTTAMVNIGIEALFPRLGVAPRRVLFVSLEESHKQILRRFSLCLAYRNANSEEREQLRTVKNPYSGKADPKNAYRSLKRGWQNIDKMKEYGPGVTAFETAIIKADKQIKGSVEAGNLVFFNGIGAPLSELLAAIRGRGQGDIVLVDYIQKIPAAGQSYSGNPDLERIRKGSEGLIEAAMGAECVVIAGAQFNRESQKGTKEGDTFTDADFRGCGDLEQDGHNLLGIGRNADKTQYYYGIIKSREGEITDKRYILDFAGGYSYMSRGEEEFTPPPKKNTSKTDEKPWIKKGMTKEQYIERDGWPL